jgi:hypothetical protein
MISYSASCGSGLQLGRLLKLVPQVILLVSVDKKLDILEAQ